MSIDELAEAAKLVSDRINEVADAAEDAARLKTVRATIYVNAIHGLGCTEEEATAYADGTSEKTFVQALIERFDGVNATDQAERIKELEEVAPLLEPFRKHLEHARREGYLAGAQAVHAEWSEKDADFSEAANDYATALIEGATND